MQDVRFGECRFELRLRDHTFGWERFHIYHSALLDRTGLISKKDFDLIWDVSKTSFQDDPQTASSRHFYISQWYRDSDAEIRKNSNKSKPRKKDKPEKSRRRGRRGRDSDSESSDDDA